MGNEDGELQETVDQGFGDHYKNLNFMFCMKWELRDIFLDYHHMTYILKAHSGSVLRIVLELWH